MLETNFINRVKNTDIRAILLLILPRKNTLYVVSTAGGQVKLKLKLREHYTFVCFVSVYCAAHVTGLIIIQTLHLEYLVVDLNSKKTIT
jgi:hypothetical protein